jgi:small-conductance mechanosensitive channel
MDERLSAEENLRVIRTLMERATMYRAISAPTALVAGLLSILAASAIFLSEANLTVGRPIRSRQFAVTWIIVLILSLAANTFFVWREARKTGRPFISPGMKLALRAIAPCLLIPAAFTGWFFTTGYLGGQELELVVVWVAFYGLALLSTTLFAPRSLAVLGWAFLFTGLSVPALVNWIEGLPGDIPNLAMGITFGLYHLIYAAATWPRKRASEAAQIAIE